MAGIGKRLCLRTWQCGLFARVHGLWARHLECDRTCLGLRRLGLASVTALPHCQNGRHEHLHPDFPTTRTAERAPFELGRWHCHSSKRSCEAKEPISSRVCDRRILKTVLKKEGEGWDTTGGIGRLLNHPTWLQNGLLSLRWKEARGTWTSR